MPQYAEKLGLSYRASHAVVSCKRVNNVWCVTLSSPSGLSTINSQFIADASGRVAHIARLNNMQRNNYDKVIGIVSFIKTNLALPSLTYIEAVKNGCWYATPLKNNVLATAFFTDTDLLSHDRINKYNYHERIRNTGLICTLLPDDLAPTKLLIKRSACTAVLEKRTGQKWLSVGDAAFSFDPVSSFGILSALQSGYYVGNAIADDLNGMQEALPAYNWVLDSLFDTYRRMHYHQYFTEQRWPEEPFWNRRYRGLQS